jgi:Fe-S-cluster containining protein
MARTDEPWYHDGLRFACIRCGACCTGAPGFVWVERDEMARLAEFRGEPIEQFTRRYVRRIGDRYSLIERPGGDCVFWDRGAGCTVYPARPIQCQTWPFWPENLATPQAWQRVQRVCPGAGRGRWFSVEQIEAEAARTRL